MTSTRHKLARLGAAAITAAALGVAATPASAHIQVRPAQAAPLDPTLWTMLVPNERNAATTRIQLKVPQGVVPFSFEDAPGWRRTLTYAPDKSIDTIVWRGRLPTQGLASFTFLATTPDREGQLAWKALQTYADGQIVRWIGPPDAEEPASTTTVSKAISRQNAGGEAADAGGASSPQPDAGDSDDVLPIALAAAALLLALLALVVGLASRVRHH